MEKTAQRIQEEGSQTSTTVLGGHLVCKHRVQVI